MWLVLKVNMFHISSCCLEPGSHIFAGLTSLAKHFGQRNHTHEMIKNGRFRAFGLLCVAL